MIKLDASKISIEHLIALLCSNHKLNNSVKHAIANHLILPEYLNVLNPFISSSKNSAESNENFGKLKCRLRYEHILNKNIIKIARIKAYLMQCLLLIIGSRFSLL